MKKPPKINLNQSQFFDFFDEQKKMELFWKFSEEYGPIYQLMFAGLPLGVVITSGELINLAEKNNMLRGPVMSKAAGDVMGKKGLIALDPGPEHLRIRRHVQAAFHPNVVDLYVADLSQVIERALEDWLKLHTFNVPEQTSQLARDFLFRTVFKYTSMRQDEQSVFVDLFKQLIKAPIPRTFLPKTLYFLVPQNAEYQRLKKEARQIMHRILIERQNTQPEHQDILTLLLSEKDGEVLDDETIVDNLITLFMAGYETTANALAWTIYCLATESEANERIYQEAVEGLAQLIDHKTLSKLALSDQYRREVQRKYSISSQTFGWTGDGFILDQWELPKSAMVYLITYIAHNDPKVWDEPEVFKLDREYPKWNMPFGSGERVCIGKPLVERDVTLFIALAIKGYCFEMDRKYEPLFGGTLLAPQNMTATITKRN